MTGRIIIELKTGEKLVNDPTLGLNLSRVARIYTE